jgi:hypothetical protein
VKYSVEESDEIDSRLITDDFASMSILDEIWYKEPELRRVFKCRDFKIQSQLSELNPEELIISLYTHYKVRKEQ